MSIIPSPSPTPQPEPADSASRLAHLVGSIEAWVSLMDVSDAVRVEKIRGLLAEYDRRNAPAPVLARVLDERSGGGHR